MYGAYVSGNSFGIQWTAPSGPFTSLSLQRPKSSTACDNEKIYIHKKNHKKFKGKMISEALQITGGMECKISFQTSTEFWPSEKSELNLGDHYH